MVDFVGRSQGPIDRARVWGGYWGEADARRQQRWVNREMRDERERDHQWNRDAASYDAKQMDANAGLFSDYSEELGAYRPGNGDLESPDRLAAGYASAGATANRTTPPTGGGARARAARTRELPEVDARIDLQEPIEQRQYSRRELRDNPTLARRIQDAADRGEVVIGNLAGGNVMVYPRRGAPANTPHIGPLYFPRGNSGDPGGGFGFGIDPRFTAGELGFREVPRRQVTIDVTGDSSGAGVPTEPDAPSATVGIPDGTDQSIEQMLNQGSVEPDVDYGAPGPDPSTPTAPGGLEPPTADTDINRDTYFGTNDASRGMRPTREMRMIASEVERNFGLARLAAQNGRREEAQVAYAAALQGQAGYLGLMRRAQYQAFAAGNWAAGADLMAQFAGYDQGDMQIVRAPGTPDRFVTQVRTEDGWQTISEESYTYQDYANGLLNLVDAERAAARSEANMEMVRAQYEANADITVARINSQASLNDNITALLQTRLTVEARNAWEEGRAEVHQNNETGDAYMVYRQYNPQTRRYEQVAINLAEEEVRVPGVDGNETEQRVVGRRITGIPGATPYVPGPGAR